VADVLRASGLAACTPVILLHSFGYLLGYGLPKLLGFNEKTSRTGDWHAVLL
jgi:predicted Na+-dependent transporter